MKNIPRTFQFGEHSADIDQIKDYYDEMVTCLDEKYDITRDIYVGQSARSIRQERDKLFLELNIEGGLALLTAVEAMFRKDFIYRCKRKHKKQIDKDFKAALENVDKLYKIDIKETILDRWKQEYPLNVHAISKMKEYMDYRNWIAHGRYWNKFNDAGRGIFSFLSLYGEISALIALMGDSLLSPEPVGTPTSILT